MDTIYVNRGSTFQRSLTILVSVISRPTTERAVVDCGMKEISAERGLSLVKDIEGVGVEGTACRARVTRNQYSGCQFAARPEDRTMGTV